MDWPNWRGPEQNRISRETGLIDKWDPETGENVLWESEEAAGISCPIVMNGKVYTQVRYKPDTKEEQEEVICLNADTGKKLWESRWNVYLSDVPAERIGWSSVVGDPDTGRVFSLGVNGYFSCIDGQTGKTVWSRSLCEEFGMISPYGGRTHPPAIFEDLVIINAVMVGWGDTAIPAHRILALDKNTGDVRWFTHTKERPEDTVFSTPTFTVIGGQTVMVIGSADGSVWAFQPRTGKSLWNFQMSKRGLNVSPTVIGDKVFVAQAEENLYQRTQGSLTCFTGSGEGDITKTNEKWHLTGVMDGKSSPLVLDGRVYSADDSGNLYIVDAETGKLIGGRPTRLLGTIVRASPLAADGKIYLCSTTGWHVMQPTPTGVKFLSKMRLPEKDEVSGSLAISHGKIYLPTGAALYCLGKKDVKPSATAIPPQPKEEPAGKDDKPAWVQVTPGELLLKPGEQKKLSVLTFNAKGQRLPAKSDLNVTGDTSGKPSAKVFTATVGDIKGEVRGRTIPPLPWKFDFNDIELKPDANNPNLPPSGEPPLTWIGARYRHKIMEKDGDKAMVKITTIPRGTRSQCWMGPPDMHDYTIQADLRGQRTTQPAGAVAVSSDATGAEINPSSSENQALGLPDMGLIAQRYTLDMMGNSQQLQIRS